MTEHHYQLDKGRGRPIKRWTRGTELFAARGRGHIKRGYAVVDFRPGNCQGVPPRLG